MISAAKRLQKELQGLQKEPPQFVRAKPLEDDILVFHYVLEGPPKTPFEGGHYHGVLKFTSEYPMKPPSVIMYTPNGRFQTNTRICMNMSDFHPETWNPVWSVGTILVGLLSFMLEESSTVGSISTDDNEKRRLARQSLEYNVTHHRDFGRLFPELVELNNKRKADAAAAVEEASRLSAARAVAAAAAAGAAPAAAGATAASGSSASTAAAADAPTTTANGAAVTAATAATAADSVAKALAGAPPAAPAAGAAAGGGMLGSALVFLVVVIAIIIAAWQRRAVAGAGGAPHA